MSGQTPEPGDVNLRIAPWLSVPDAGKAVEFYTAAFGAVETYRLDDESGRPVVVHLEAGDADFWVQEDPEMSPGQGRSPVRMIISLDDPDALFRQVLAAGARELVPIEEAHGWRIGRVADPFGHHWEIGKQLG